MKRSDRGTSRDDRLPRDVRRLLAKTEQVTGRKKRIYEYAGRTITRYAGRQYGK